MPQFTDGRTRNIRVWTPADYDKGDATAPMTKFSTPINSKAKK